MSLLDNLPHLATHKIRVRTKGTTGGSKDTPTTVATDVECWQQGAGDSEVREYDKRGITVTHKVYYVSDPGLDERHIIVIGSDTLEVRSASSPDASVGLGILYRVMCELTTTGSTP